MGRLAGFRYSEVVRKLKRLGFTFDRQAKGSHEIWWNPATRARTTISNHLVQAVINNVTPSNRSEARRTTEMLGIQCA